jgi:hypothetical protein
MLQGLILFVLSFFPVGNNKKSIVTFAKDSFGKMAQSRQEKINLELPDLEKTPAIVPKYR